MAQINHQQSSADVALKSFKVGESNWSGYDLETFTGRFMNFREVCSPEKSFHSQATISKYQADVKQMISERANALGEAVLTEQEFAEYRHKRLVLASATSPGSDKIIPWFSRTSSFVPMSIPISMGMVMSPATQAWTILWQVVNTTYCAGLNYSNGCGGATDDEKRRMSKSQIDK